MIRLATASVVMLLAGLPFTAAADGNTGIVRGRVLLTGTNQPVCPISVEAVSNRESPWITHTNADGSFVFLQIRPGPVELVVGKNRERRFITVSANLQNQETFYLEPLRSPGHHTSSTMSRQVAQTCSGTSYHGYAGG